MNEDERTADFFAEILARELEMYDVEVDPITHTVTWPDYANDALLPRALAAGMSVEELVLTTLTSCAIMNPNDDESNPDAGE
jgi:hypothetical protein